MLNIEAFRGRINDLDTHIQPSPHNYELAGGEVGRQFSKMFDDLIRSLPQDEAAKILARSGAENMDLNDQTVWHTKGSTAPGAFDPDNRLKTLDYMGVNRSFIFSDPGIQTAAFADNPLGIATMKHWNDFILGFSKSDPNRLRTVSIINTHNIDVATAEVERVLKLGGRTFVMPCSVAPGNVSPAHPAMDKFWGLIQEANATITLHLGGGRSVGDEFDFIKNPNWDKGIGHLSTQEFDVTAEGDQMNTYTFSAMLYAPQNFISTLILGGVFERFPRLRFAAIELGALWLGPMAGHLDNVVKVFRRRMEGVLSLSPSEYLRRNVRVTPFWFENVADFIDHYGLKECYCYSSDFPHPEGGTKPQKDFEQSLRRLGQSSAESFYVTNSEWVLPAL
jgi:predicted TIM-barrel fold metal-dependent hydrolase